MYFSNFNLLFIQFMYINLDVLHTIVLIYYLLVDDLVSNRWHMLDARSVMFDESA